MSAIPYAQNHLQQIKPQLEQYEQALKKWSKAYNLMGPNELDRLWDRHFLDSLLLAPWVNGTQVLDLGTGGGLPGLPLAMLKPDINFVLLDSVGKKTRFVTQVARSLQLGNVTVVHTRSESYHVEKKFDQIVSRAVAQVNQLIGWSDHLLDVGGEILLLKGQAYEKELQAMPCRYKVIDIIQAPDASVCIRLQKI